MDSGSSTCVVSPKIFNAGTRSCDALFDVSGTQIEVKGRANLKLNFTSAYAVETNFLVAEVPNFPVIIGADFIERENFKINFENKTFSNSKVTLPLVFHEDLRATTSVLPTINHIAVTPQMFYRTNSTHRKRTRNRIVFGRIKWLNFSLGYGFIKRCDGKGDVFLHVSNIVSSLPKCTKKNQLFQFSIVHNGFKHPKAINAAKIQENSQRVDQPVNNQNVCISVVEEKGCINQLPKSTAVGFFVFERNLGKPLLIDCGATQSVLSKKLLKTDIQAKNRLSAASGSPLDTLGSVQIDLDLGFKTALRHSFVIAELSTADALLGLDFLESYGVTVNSQGRTLELNSDCAKLVYGNRCSFDVDTFCNENLLDIHYDEQLDSLNCLQYPLSVLDDNTKSQQYTNNGNTCNNSISLVYSNEGLSDETDLARKCVNFPEYKQVTVNPSYLFPARHSVKFDICLTVPMTSLRQKARPCSSQNRKILRDTFLDRVDRGVVERGSPTHVCPTTIVKKKDGSPRVCVDYTRLNNVTQWINYPLPQMNTLTSIVTPKHKWFSVIDLKEAYFSLPLTPRASQYAGIITPDGAFTPKRCQFGLRNAPFKFCQLIDEVTHGFKDFVFTYLDDFLIFSETPDQHLEHVQAVLLRLANFGLFINKDKSIFGRQKVSFLGRIISAVGVHLEQGKIDHVLQQKPPSTLRELRSFLGLINHYRPHLPHLSKIAAPLNNMLRGPKRVKRAPIPWNTECQQSFDAVLQAVQNAVSLSYDDPDLPLILSTDASQGYAGAVLEQPIVADDLSRRRPLAFYSKELPKSKTTRSAFNRELCALRMSIQYFRHRIRGRRLVIFTDHKSLVPALINGTGQHSPMEIAWLDEIREYGPETRYIKGSENVVADYLSRPVSPPDDALPVHHVSLVNANDPDPIASDHIPAKVLAQMQIQDRLDPKDVDQKHGTVSQATFLSDEGEEVHISGVKDHDSGLFRPYVPNPLRPIVFKLFHAPIHSGSEKTIDLIRGNYFWPSMVRDISHWALHCPKCQKNKITRHNRQRLVNFPTEPGRLNIVHIDLVGPIPNNDDFKYILTMRDRNSGYLCTAPLPDKTTEAVIYSIEQNFVSKLGIPDCFISDNGKEFTSNKFKVFCLRLGITHRTTNSYHPQAQGAVERVHRILNSSIRSLSDPASWHRSLPYITLQFNNETSGLNSFTPYQIVFGKPGKLPGALMRPVEDDPTEISTDAIRAFLSLMSCHELEARPLRDNHPFIEKELLTNSSCWVRNEAPESHHVSPLYKGPFEILGRSEKTYVLSIDGKPTSVSIDRLKTHKTCNEEDCIRANLSDENDELDDLNLQISQTTSEDQPNFPSTRSRRTRLPLHLQDYVLY